MSNFGADVDAARRLVEQEHFRAPGDRAREHHLLLIAAAQAPDALARPADFRRTRRPKRHGFGALGAPVDEGAEAARASRDGAERRCA